MKKIGKIMVLVLILTIVLSVEIVLSLPTEKTETLNIVCIGSHTLMLMPGVSLLTEVKVNTYNPDGTYIGEVVFHAYEDNQFELGELEVNKRDYMNNEIPTRFNVTYVEVGLFPFRDCQVKNVIEV